MSKFGPQHWNAIAYDLRQERSCYKDDPWDDPLHRQFDEAKREVIDDVAVRFAQRFAEDNPEFDAENFFVSIRKEET